MTNHTDPIPQTLWVTDKITAANMSYFATDNSVSVLAYNVAHDAIIQINMDLVAATNLLQNLTEAIQYAEQIEELHDDTARRTMNRVAWERHPGNQTPRTITVE